MTIACFSAVTGENEESKGHVFGVIVGSDALLMHDGKWYQFTTLI